MNLEKKFTKQGGSYSDKPIEIYLYMKLTSASFINEVVHIDHIFTVNGEF